MTKTLHWCITFYADNPPQPKTEFDEKTIKLEINFVGSMEDSSPEAWKHARFFAWSMKLSPSEN